MDRATVRAFLAHAIQHVADEIEGCRQAAGTLDPVARKKAEELYDSEDRWRFVATPRLLTMKHLAEELGCDFGVKPERAHGLPQPQDSPHVHASPARR